MQHTCTRGGELIMRSMPSQFAESTAKHAIACHQSQEIGLITNEQQKSITSGCSSTQSAKSASERRSSAFLGLSLTATLTLSDSVVDRY